MACIRTLARATGLGCRAKRVVRRFLLDSGFAHALAMKTRSPSPTLGSLLQAGPVSVPGCIEPHDVGSVLVKTLPSLGKETRKKSKSHRRKSSTRGDGDGDLDLGSSTEIDTKGMPPSVWSGGSWESLVPAPYPRLLCPCRLVVHMRAP